MMKAFCVASLAAMASAECPNGCNGHGKCTSYDMCICNRNWQANDCSERVCQFGKAHVDTPIGDLDMNGEISGPDQIVSENSAVFPYGVPEQFPQGRDSDLNEVLNSAHYYMECSNKGKCNREEGVCECFEGYDGAACQRASCPGYPNSCSGHGVCKSIRQLANADGGNVYELWDRHSTMGCECDSGFSGPDCSERQCKSGIDPLYYDDSTTIRYSTWDFAILTNTVPTDGDSDIFSNGMYAKDKATFALRFYDLLGEDWVTYPITYGASCDKVTQALYDLPNDVIPVGSLICTKSSSDTLVDTLDESATGGFNEEQQNTLGYARGYDTVTRDRPIYRDMAFWEYGLNYLEIGSDRTAGVRVAGTIYRIKFAGNPGKLQQPEIVTDLDGTRPTLQIPVEALSATVPAGVPHTLITRVWTDGQQGESKDYFADYCAGVTVNIGTVTYKTKTVKALTGLTSAEEQTLKRCLGSSDFDDSNNVDIYDWDYGSDVYPHIVKLVLTTASSQDGGYYVALRYWCHDGTPLPSGSGSTYDGYSNTGTGAGAGVNLCRKNPELASKFILISQFEIPDLSADDEFDVYTTRGVLARSASVPVAYFGFGSNQIYVYPKDNNDPGGIYHLHGDIACEINDNNGQKVNYWTRNDPASETTCLNKTDIFTLLSPLDWYSTPMHADGLQQPVDTVGFSNEYYLNHGDLQAAKNPRYLNLYTVKKIYQSRFTTPLVQDGEKYNHFNGTYIIETDINTNFAASTDMNVQVYKFFPASTSTYTYTSQCSNRGICNHETGLCECFKGYTNDDCSAQNSLSL